MREINDAGTNSALVIILIICGVVMLGFGLIGMGQFVGADDQTAEQQQYCTMWEIWHADRRAGVPVEKRYGWPDQAGRYYQECDQ